MTAPTWLTRAADKASRHPSTLGFALSRATASRPLDAPFVAGYLGCEVATVQWLALCFRPQREEDLTRIAQRFAVDRQRLADLLLVPPAARD